MIPSTVRSAVRLIAALTPTVKPNAKDQLRAEMVRLLRMQKA